MLYTEDQVHVLFAAMWQILDDMGTSEQSSCEAAKAQARVAFEPFIGFIEGEQFPVDQIMDLAEAERMIHDVTNYNTHG